MSEPKHIIHIRIRDLRRQKALTQEELAAALGISRQSINAMEAGRCLPSLPVALQIASFFAVPLSTVFGAAEASERLQLQEGQVAENELPQWTPMQEMQEALEELMDTRTQWLPPANIFQTAHEVVVEVYVPGFTKDQLSIEVGEDFVKVAGHPAEEVRRAYFRREVMERPFQRNLVLPAFVKHNQAEAEFRLGVLTIRVPKIAEETPKSARITIRSAE